MRPHFSPTDSTPTRASILDNLARIVTDAVIAGNDVKLPHSTCTVSQSIADSIGGEIREELFRACHHAMVGRDRLAAHHLRAVVRMAAADYSLIVSDVATGDE